MNHLQAFKMVGQRYQPYVKMLKAYGEACVSTPSRNGGIMTIEEWVREHHSDTYAETLKQIKAAQHIHNMVNVFSELTVARERGFSRVARSWRQYYFKQFDGICQSVEYSRNEANPAPDGIYEASKELRRYAQKTKMSFDPKASVTARQMIHASVGLG
jgi:hypothetical protein